MTSETREEVVGNGIDGEGKQRKEKKGKMKKDKEKKGVSLGGREAKGGVITKKADAFGDSHSQRNGDAEQSSKVLASTVASTLTRLKKQVENDRSMYVKTTMDANNGKLQEQVAQFFQFAEDRGKLSGVEDGTEAKDLLTVRIQKAHCRVSGLDSNALEKDGVNIQEDGSSTFLSLLSGSSPGGKSVVCPVKLPTVEKHPPYTTWIFLDRNQKMVEDQSVLGRRRIYYDQNGSEALICSDSEEEQVDDEDEKHEFSKGEDYIIRRAIQEHGLGETVLETLANCTEAKPCEIEARYEALQNEDLISQENFIDDGAADSKIPLIEEEKPLGCSSRKIDIKDESAERQETVSFKSNPGEETNFDDKDLAAAMDSFDNLFCRRCLVFDCRLHGCSQTVIIPTEKQPAWSDPEGANTPCGPNCRLLKYCEGKGDNAIDSGKSAKTAENSKWTKLEKGLYEKGLEIFGKNSCLVARNMLKGMKTCLEVAEYLLQHEVAAQCRAGDNHKSHLAGSGKAAECDDAVDVEVRTRTRFWRRRGRVRRLKYTWKSAGHPAIRKRIADIKDQPCKQYVPCGCQFSCGKQCSCLRGGTCCEKYCGCSKSCKNRFRGCHCAKSQCRSRQCPCFAAGRECDPDVCRNCWVGCGDGTLGGPPQRGDNYECRNMKLLLRQQQRVLLGRSDVAGWGAFLKNSVSRHDYLGEYTGELISHREADKRGKIYDRENSSFLFNLNDQYVLDAYRKGDKLKFANHSPNPNCYAKVIMVAGDHRVGIFAKDRISAGEELFYDYRYEPDRAPVWARKPEGSNSKREEPCATGRRAQKVA